MSFENRLKKTLLESLGNDYSDNYDRYTHGPEDRGRWPGEWFQDFKWKYPIISRRKYVKRLMKKKATKCRFLYERLSSESERDLLLKLIAYRRLGWRRVKLPDHGDYFDVMAALEQKFETIKGEKLESPFPFELYLNDFSSFGFPVKIYSSMLAIYYEVIKDQYQYEEIGFRVDPGDFVVDAGACVGDSTFFFAHRAGPEGKVFAFEMLPENLRVLKENIDLNKERIGNIEVVEHPVSEKSGQEFFIYSAGPASQIRDEPVEGEEDFSKVSSLSIDDFVSQSGLERLDMIKMDVEGAELSALKGAAGAIKKFRPKLAICVYHKECDLDEIPRYIDSLGMNYSFHLKHHGIQLGETVLYCL